MKALRKSRSSLEGLDGHTNRFTIQPKKIVIMKFVFESQSTVLKSVIGVDGKVAVVGFFYLLSACAVAL